MGPVADTDFHNPSYSSVSTIITQDMILHTVFHILIFRKVVPIVSTLMTQCPNYDGFQTGTSSPYLGHHSEPSCYHEKMLENTNRYLSFVHLLCICCSTLASPRCRSSSRRSRGVEAAVCTTPVQPRTS